MSLRHLAAHRQCMLSSIWVEIMVDWIAELRERTSHARLVINGTLEIGDDGCQLIRSDRNRAVGLVSAIAARSNWSSYPAQQLSTNRRLTSGPLLPHHFGHWMRERLDAAGYDSHGACDDFELESMRLLLLAKLQRQQLRRLSDLLRSAQAFFCVSHALTTYIFVLLCVGQDEYDSLSDSYHDAIRRLTLCL